MDMPPILKTPIYKLHIRHIATLAMYCIHRSDASPQLPGARSHTVSQLTPSQPVCRITPTVLHCNQTSGQREAWKQISIVSAQSIASTWTLPMQTPRILPSLPLYSPSFSASSFVSCSFSPLCRSEEH